MRKSLASNYIEIIQINSGSCSSFISDFSKDWKTFLPHFPAAKGYMASLVTQWKRIPLTVQETQVWSLGWEVPLEKEMATHSSILTWEILWTLVGYSPKGHKEPDTTKQQQRMKRRHVTSEYRLGSQTPWAESKLHTFQLCALVSPSVK